jgi:hypothetical protein
VVCGTIPYYIAEQEERASLKYSRAEGMLICKPAQRKLVQFEAVSGLITCLSLQDWLLYHEKNTLKPEATLDLRKDRCGSFPLSPY